MGIDIGGTKISFGLFNENGELIQKEIIASDDQKPAEQFFGEIAEFILKYQQLASENDSILTGVGIGVPGFVEFETGRLSKVASLPLISGFPAREFLQTAVHDPDLLIRLDNDGHCGALAEYRQGAGAGHQNIIYALISTGISTTMILDGKLFRGSNGAAGESGHMVSAVSGKKRRSCMCGNHGCFNSLGSGKAIADHVRQWIADGETTIMTDLAGTPEVITAEHISMAYDLQDPLAIRAVEQMAHYLGIWIFDVYMLMNIDCIIFSGGLLAMGDKLLKKIQEEFETYHTNGFPVHFHVTALGSDSCLIGAMELVR